jgi:hypothetical protein
MHLDPKPSRPTEDAPLRCPKCESPTFPREPGARTAQVRCPNGHWFRLGASVCIDDADLAGLGRSDGGGAP